MAKTVHCAKLNQELPGIDAETSEGARALKMALLIGGPEMRDRVEKEVSLQAWDMWTRHMLMLMNEFRLDPQSPESNEAIKPHMHAFFFGEEQQVPGYTPPST